MYAQVLLDNKFPLRLWENEVKLIQILTKATSLRVGVPRGVGTATRRLKSTQFNNKHLAFLACLNQLGF